MSNPSHATPPKQHDDWENWTDEDEAVTPKIKEASFVQIGSAANNIRFPTTARSSKNRKSSNSTIQRLKSRKRQKAQNEKAGIKVVTDLTKFRKGPQHVAQLVRTPVGFNNESVTKFVDTSALRALEGSPNSASVGNWAWFNKGGQSPATTAASATPKQQHIQQYSPDDSKIIIGISMPEDNGLMISPQTAVVATTTTNPFDNRLPPTTQQKPNSHQPKSAWSPDTEDGGFSPARYLSNNLGIYTQSTGGQIQPVPPVPAVPSPFKNPTTEKLSRSEIDDDDDNFTPVTLFEEDGKSPASAISNSNNKISPETATTTRSGWWDHVKTPFKERFSPVVGKNAAVAATASPTVAADEWWKSADEKKSMPNQQQAYYTGASDVSSLRPVVPVIRVPTPTGTASSSRSSPAPSSSFGGYQQDSKSSSASQHSEKARVVMEEHSVPSDVPPPYELTPSEKQPTGASNYNNDSQATAKRYRAVFPPGHPLATQFPPSPMPVSPGLEANMTARGDMKMSDVPLTPAAAGPNGQAEPALPDRVAGTYVTGDQHRDLTGASSPQAQIEKTRRRHEKEDYLARKVGGFWKGRGCLPEDGCYGRSGREGRKRRRVWLGICLAFLLLTILGVVLGVVLSQKLSSRATSVASDDGTSSSDDGSSTGSGSGSDTQASSVWLNLTDFPPIPTGLATIVGADNSEEVTGCVSPATLWSCSLPPEQQAANEPQEANQPKFIFQIQYDNNTRQLWDIPNGDAPTPDTTAAAAATSSTAKATSSTSTKATSTVTVAAATATTTASSDDEGSDLTRRDDTTLYDTGIAPNPSPPSYDEMWFLGNWTDEIVSDEKAGEPTPFYISFFTSLNGSAGPNMLTDSANTKRGDIGSGSDNGENVTDTLPSPILNADGTGAAAQLRPFPYQQPLRLFDRGLDTEHYGFYSYFNKTIYVESMEKSTSSSEEGGVLETSAQWYATWTQTRFIVKIWTKKQNTSSSSARLIGTSGTSASDNSTAPGSFPYPVTIGEDTHGGDLSLKETFAYGVEADQHVNISEAMSFTNNIGYGSAVVNPRLPDGDLSWGGVDGGKGGCRCEWVNWVNGDGTTDGSLG